MIPLISEKEARFKDTVILENTIFEPVVNPNTGPNEKFERLPKGESITITMKPGEEIDILLSRYECKIYSKDNKIFFEDNEKRSYELDNGRSAYWSRFSQYYHDGAWTQRYFQNAYRHRKI